MKRDWDVIRQILIACEDAPAGAKLSDDELEQALPSVDPVVLFEHVRMLDSAGYLDAALMPTSRTPAGGGHFVIRAMLWDGHDLIAKMKSDTWWAKVKSMAADKGLELTFDVIKTLAAPALAAIGVAL